jgi:hypothetical protein
MKVSCVCRNSHNVLFICQSSSIYFVVLESTQEVAVDHTYVNANNDARLTLDWSLPDVTTGMTSLVLILSIYNKMVIIIE